MGRPRLKMQVQFPVAVPPAVLPLSLLVTTAVSVSRLETSEDVAFSFLHFRLLLVGWDMCIIRVGT